MNSIRTKALELLRSPHFFRCFLADIRRAGLVGEEVNALAIYIVAISRLLPEPLSALIKGPSSVGKNCLTDAVLAFIPDAEVRTFTNSSQRSWNYQGDKLMHKVVYIKERNEDSGPVHPLRLLVSERFLTYFVTAREGNRSVVRKVVTRGPVAAISTTTKDRVEVDDETRHLSIWLDDSPEQTGRIVRAALERELQETSLLSRDELASWHEVQRLLKSRSRLPVNFPGWMTGVALSVQTDSIWARRYFPAFLRAVKTVALIRSFQCSTKELNQQGNILVRFRDVAIATLIFGPVFAQSLRRTEDMDVEIRQRIANISAARDGKPVSARDLSEAMKISVDKGYALIRKAETAGTIHRANPSNKTNLKLYLPSRLKGFLPTPEEILQQLTTGPRLVRFVHPLTGKWVVYERE